MEIFCLRVNRRAGVGGHSAENSVCTVVSQWVCPSSWLPPRRKQRELYIILHTIRKCTSLSVPLIDVIDPYFKQLAELYILATVDI